MMRGEEKVHKMSKLYIYILAKSKITTKNVSKENISNYYLQTEQFQLFTIDLFAVIIVLVIILKCDFWISLNTYEHCK